VKLSRTLLDFVVNWDQFNHLEIIVLTTILIVSLLFQPELPNQYVLERAKLDFTHIGDVPRFIAEHRARVDAEIARLVAGEKLVDVPYEGRKITIEGRLRPDLVRMERALGIIIYGDFTATSHQELIARGLSRDDLLALEKVTTRENKETAFVNRILFNDVVLSSTPGKAKYSDEEVIAYIQRHEEVIREAKITWATGVLESLSLRGRRILVSYAYEVIVPHATFFYREGPYTKEQIEPVRRSLISPDRQPEKSNED